MLEFIVKGKYNENERCMEYVGYSTDKRTLKKGRYVSSKQEAEVSVIGIFLKIAYDEKEDVKIKTNLNDGVKYANGVWKKASSKRVSDYLRYLSKIKEKIKVDIDFLDEDKYLFKVIVYKENSEEVLHCLTDKDFGEKNIADAIFLANWYENRHHKVERFNVPPPN